jgi:glycosyltransferase involved in cell wall biosynthesis
MAELRTLIVGGAYTEFEGAPHVPERCWRMVQIFSDQIARPRFARRCVISRDRSFFSTPFPEPADLVALNPSPGRMPWQRVFPQVAWNRAWYGDLLDEVDAVYCRFPSSSWGGVHLYNLAVARQKLVFASLHGDWPGVYRHLAQDSHFPKSAVYSRAARVTEQALTHVAKTARILFCVGEDLNRRYGASARASVTFANYLHRESDLFRREDTCLRPPYRIVYVGELTIRKGVKHILGAVGRLRAAGIPTELSLVGKGDESGRLIEQAESLGLAGNVRMHGYVTFGRRLFDLYRESDVFVLPSLVGEGAPKVVVEAMSQGLPVVASDVGSTGFILNESGAGLLVPPGDEPALAEAVRQIIEDASLRQRLISRGLEFAERMTNESQRRIVADALERHIPEVVRANR